MKSHIHILLIAFLPLGAEADIRISSGCYIKSREMEHIDDYGHAVKAYRLGTFSLGDRDVPLYAYWTSAAHSTRTTLGHGWHVPWFESRMLPIDGARYRFNGGDARHKNRSRPRRVRLHTHMADCCIEDHQVCGGEAPALPCSRRSSCSSSSAVGDFLK